MNPDISVIIPLFNKEFWVKKCIESVLMQTYQNIEVLIIDDGSTDNSVRVVEQIEDTRIKIFSKKNEGVSSARNLGIENARGQYLAFIDADDEWNSRHLELLEKGLRQNKKAILICSNYVEVFENLVSVKYQKNLPFAIKENKVAYHFIDSYLNTLSAGFFLLTASSVLIRSSVVLENNVRFKTELKYGEDLNYWIQLSQFGLFLFCDYIGLKYNRIDNQSAMNLNGTKARFVPSIFHGIDIGNYSQTEQDLIKKIVIKEYYKKSYQNRGSPFLKKELSRIIGGGIRVGSISVLLYILIRYCPKFLFTLLKNIRAK